MKKMTLPYFQLFLIRVYLGLDIIPHFTEKLFQGPEHRAEVVKAFVSLGLSYPTFMVILAGLIELSIAIGFTFGFMTRIAAVGAALYLVISSFLGGHFVNGFMWVKPGGGWEFPVLWAFLCLTFILTGGGPWSLDALLRQRSKLWIYK
ncbi:MAG: DoxX family protein [Gammaproteobacteria bacterium]